MSGLTAVSGSAPVTGIDNAIAQAIAEVETPVVPVVEEVKPEEVAAEIPASEIPAEKADEIKALPDDPLSVQNRVNKLNEKYERLAEEKLAITEENAMLRQETAKLVEKAKRWDDAEAVAKYDARVRDIFENHPVLGKKPRPATLDDFDGDAEAYAQHREEVLRRSMSDESKNAEADRKRTEEYVSVLDKSEARCKDHPIYAQFLKDEAIMKGADEAIKKAWLAGNPYSSFEQVFAALHSDKIIEAATQQALEKAETMAREREAKKLSQLPPGAGGPPPAKKPDLSKMTRDELIQYHINAAG